MAIVTVLVEDSKVIRENLTAALADLTEVEIAAFGETADEGIAALQAKGPSWQLAVVDLFLKSGSGLTVVRWCANREKHQRVVVLTNYATSAIRESCLAAGADGVFDKSNELEAFFDFVNGLDSVPVDPSVRDGEAID